MNLDEIPIEKLQAALKRRGAEIEPIPNINRNIEMVSCLKELPSDRTKVMVFRVELMEVKEVSTSEVNGDTWTGGSGRWNYWAYFPEISDEPKEEA